MPEVAPEFAVGHRAQTERFLPSHRRADAPILHLAQPTRRDGASLGGHAGLVQLAGAQQAADVLGSKRWRHRLLPSLRRACTMHEMPFRLIALLLFGFAAVAHAAAPALPGAEWMLEQIKVLSALDMDGRGSGTPGADRAARRIADIFRAAGLRPGGDSGQYLQGFTVPTGTR